MLINLTIRPGLAKCLTGIGLWLCAAVSTAQLDSMRTLQEVEVKATRIDLTDIGKHSEQLDSQMLAMRHYNNLSEVLAFQTPLYVRSYGVGTLATLGIRGGSAVHTQFLWNGIPLRNPMLGQLDIALIPSSFTDEVSIHYGGHGAAYGSGAIGGLISLSNQTIPSKGRATVHLSGGSWGWFSGDVRLVYGTPTIRFSTRVFLQRTDNNYRYRLSKDSPEKNQVHHLLKNKGLLQEATWNINAHESLTARLWLQSTDRQIPPTSVQTVSQSAQQDHSFRASLHWQKEQEKVKWQLKTAIMNEDIDYQDSLILLYTENSFKTWWSEFESSIQLSSRFNLTTGAFSEWVTATSANYSDKPERKQYGAFASLRYLMEDWVLRYQMREEITDGRWSPLLIDLSAEWSGIRHVTWKSSLSRNYRIPSMNDIYWKPGGNADLIPEQGWTVETGLHVETQTGKWVIKASGTGFARTIDDWIMWLPPVGGNRNFWSPVNILQVNSYGGEFRGNVTLVDDKWHTDISAGLDLTWSQFANDLPEFMIEKGEQVFYIPKENFFTGVRVGRKHWDVYYNHHWFGASNGISESVAAGNIGSAGVSVLPGKSTSWSLYLQADNIWNVPYRLIERRPMPGRSLKFGLRFYII